MFKRKQAQTKRLTRNLCLLVISCVALASVDAADLPGNWGRIVAVSEARAIPTPPESVEAIVVATSDFAPPNRKVLNELQQLKDAKKVGGIPLSGIDLHLLAKTDAGRYILIRRVTGGRYFVLQEFKPRKKQF